MTDLINKKCTVCEGGTEPLNLSEAQKWLAQVPGWSISDDGLELIRRFQFKNFLNVMNFVNAVAYIAQHEGHHPDLKLGYNYCEIRYTTHAINGLSENDFICSAKINALL